MKSIYCWAYTFEAIEHDTVLISTLLCTRNPYTYSYFEISICIYSVRGENDQMSTNTFRYSTCCAANVSIFVYIFIGNPILLLSSYNFPTESYACNISSQNIIAQQSCLSKSEPWHNCHHDTVTIIRMKIVADQKEHEGQYQQVPPQIIDRSAGWRFQIMLPLYTQPYWYLMKGNSRNCACSDWLYLQKMCWILLRGDDCKRVHWNTRNVMSQSVVYIWLPMQ